MKRFFLLFLACVIITQGCANNSTEVLTEQEKTIITEEVKARVVDYFDAAKQLDLERMLNFWANTEGYVVAGDGTLVAGYDKHMSEYKNAIANIDMYSNVEHSDPHIYVLASDAASCAIELSYSFTTKSGDTTNVKGSWMYVLKKFDDTWRVVHSAGTHIYD